MNRKMQGHIEPGDILIRAHTALLMTIAADYIIIQAELRFGLLTFDYEEFCVVATF